MCEALTMMEGQNVNIITDSQHVHGLCTTELARMARTNWLTTTGVPCKHVDLVKQLAAVIMLPRRLAVIKCRAHTLAMSHQVIMEAHGLTHIGKTETLRRLSDWTMLKFESVVAHRLSQCSVCGNYNPKKRGSEWGEAYSHFHKSQGKVERANGEIKQKLAKTMKSTELNWV